MSNFRGSVRYVRDTWTAKPPKTYIVFLGKVDKIPHFIYYSSLPRLGWLKPPFWSRLGLLKRPFNELDYYI
jgi:hypothetical protein